MNKRKLQRRAQQLANLLHDEAMDDGIEFILLVSNRKMCPGGNTLVSNVTDAKLVESRLRKAADAFLNGKSEVASRADANAKAGL